jgi:hypothetical protein
MKENIFYVVRGHFYRSKCVKENPVKICQTFKNENPVLARQAAFTYYQDYIELLLLNKGLAFESHKKAVEDLQDFFNSFSLEEELSGVNPDFFVEITISMVIDSNVKIVTSEGLEYYSDEIEIHSFNKKSNDIECQRDYFENLRREAAIYIERNYEIRRTNSYDISLVFEDPEMLVLLESPIDFNELLTDLVLTGTKI